MPVPIRLHLRLHLMARITFGQACECTTCPPEKTVDKELLCKEATMRAAADAFLTACVGAGGCDGACKDAFETQYAGCVRGFVPVLFDGGFANETLQAILAKCAPNDRRTPLKLHVAVALWANRAPSPLQVAALAFAIDMVQQDPQLFSGFAVTITYDLFDTGDAARAGDTDGIEGTIGAAKILRHGVDKTNILIGPDSDESVDYVTRALSRFSLGNLYMVTGISISNPLNKPRFPLAVGAVGSGIKILSVFGTILQNWNWKAMLMFSALKDTTFGALIPILQAQKYEMIKGEYEPYKVGIPLTANKREILRQGRKTGVRTYGTADAIPPSLHDFALAVYEEKMYGLGWVWYVSHL